MDKSAGVWYDWGGPNRAAERRVGVANGVFPAGCKWRDVQHSGAEKEFWAVEDYEYWDEAKQRWTSKRPSGCIVQGSAGSEGCAKTCPLIVILVADVKGCNACTPNFFCTDPPQIVRCMQTCRVFMQLVLPGGELSGWSLQGQKSTVLSLTASTIISGTTMAASSYWLTVPMQ